MFTRHLTRLLSALLLFAAAPATWAHASHDHRIEHLNARLEQQPDSQALYIERGVAYSNDGVWNHALEDFQRAEQLGDPVLVAHEIGVLYYRYGKLDEALVYLSRYLKRFPDNARTLEYRARVLRDQGLVEAAITDFVRLFQLLERPNPGYYLAAAELMVSSQVYGVEAALALLDQGIAQLGLIPQLQSQAIEYERQRGHHQEALARHQSLESMLGSSPEWKVAMGEYLMAVGRKQQAIYYYRLAVQQLNVLRRTTARAQLQQRLQELMREQS